MVVVETGAGSEKVRAGGGGTSGVAAEEMREGLIAIGCTIFVMFVILSVKMVVEGGGLLLERPKAGD